MTYQRGEHPNSKANLSKSRGRPQKYGDRKKHEVLLTDNSWRNLQAIAQLYGYAGVSELFEKIGSGELTINPKTTPEGGK